MKSSVPTNLYPQLHVKHIQNPNKLWAIPLLGILVKMIILVPVFLWLMLLTIAWLVVLFIGSFYVLFTGKYWDVAYTFSLDVMRLWTKVTLYMFGLTDKYPGFGFAIDDELISLNMEKPTSPNRFFAIPLLGGLARAILLIPYFIYLGVIEYAAYIGVAFSSFPVLFTGRYPESTYELARDQMRLGLAGSFYVFGFSDRYPNFWISMNHQTVKIVLIIIGVFLWLGNILSGDSSSYSSQPPDLQNLY